MHRFPIRLQHCLQILAMLALVGLLAACGGEEEDANPTPPGTYTSAPGPMPMPGEAGMPTATGQEPQAPQKPQTERVDLENVRFAGAALGEWTMDLAAARELAREKNLPIMLNFTGSDWCGACHQINGAVLTKDDWDAWARENLVLVVLDFPRGESEMPEKYAARNEQLAASYQIDAFPTFVFLDSDGQRMLGRIRGAGPELTVTGFISQVKQQIRLSDKAIAAVTADLPEAQATRYQDLTNQYFTRKQEFDEWVAANPEATPETMAQLQQHQQALRQLQNQLEDIEISAKVADLPKNLAESYREACLQVRQAETDLMTWLETRPKESAANVAKFQQLQNDIRDAGRAMQEAEAKVTAHQLDPAMAGKYRELFTKLQAKQDELDQWMAQEPARNAENQEIFANKQAAIRRLQAEMRALAE